MTRLTVVALLLIFFGGAVAVWVARFFGKSGSRASILVTVVAQWLGAYVLWTFAGGLLLYYGIVTRYDGTLFGLVALVLGFVHYRTRVSAGREQAALVFVGGQLAWLAIVLVQNGLLGSSK
ncbi:MAG: hypothetical protein DMD91_19590 [Candidatus Rokuibacteriota bacterium]|nr:MAG: hypothetical protein DMD91_19590 [Candidatus Rokubacteria bacterium]